MLASSIKQLDMISRPAMATPGALPRHHPAPGHRHAADCRWSPRLALLSAAPLVHIICSLQPARSIICTGTILWTHFIDWKWAFILYWSSVMLRIFYRWQELDNFFTYLVIIQRLVSCLVFWWNSQTEYYDCRNEDEESLEKSLSLFYEYAIFSCVDVRI